VYLLLVHKTLDEYKQNKKHNTEKLATIGTQDTGRIQTKQKTQHRETSNNRYTRHWTNTNKTKNTTQKN
jgi:hypothetical protein